MSLESSSAVDKLKLNNSDMVTHSLQLDDFNIQIKFESLKQIIHFVCHYSKLWTARTDYFDCNCGNIP